MQHVKVRRLTPIAGAIALVLSARTAAADPCSEARVEVQHLVDEAGRGGPQARSLYEQAGKKGYDTWERYGATPIRNGEPPQCASFERLLADSATAFSRGHLVGSAVRVHMILLDPQYRLQETAEAKAAPMKIAAAFLSIATYDSAAQWYERAATTAPSEALAANALGQAIDLRLGLGQEQEALADAERLARDLGAKSPVAPAERIYQVASRLADLRAWKKAHAVLTAHLPLLDAVFDVGLQAHVLLARALGNLGRPGDAAEYARVRDAWSDPDAAVARIRSTAADDAETQRRTARALEAVAEAQFFTAEQLRATTFDSIPFPAAGSSVTTTEQVKGFMKRQLLPWFEKKRTAIDRIEAAYLQVVNLRPAPAPIWSERAAARDGGMWRDVLEGLRKAPIPASFKADGDLRTAYYEALDSALEPFKERATAAMEKCIAISAQFDLVDSYMGTCQHYLSTYYKLQHRSLGDLHAPPTLTGGPLDEPWPAATMDRSVVLSATPTEAR
jgi:hypothetical protein